MDRERFRRVEDLYHKALQLEAGQRNDFLKNACGADQDLFQEIDSLLAQEARAAGFMESPAIEAAALAAETSANSQDPSRPSMIGATLSHYLVVEKIGSGGMGEIYRARDQRLDRDVAIKVISWSLLHEPNLQRRFRKEALALSRLNHPNIAVIHEFDTQDDIDFLVMEFIPGITLNEKIAVARLPESEVVRLGIQLAEALVAAHQQSVIHLDLKPSNLRLADDGRLKVLDFGIAKSLRTSDPLNTLTELPGLQGTLPYMAPEQLLGDPVDARTDIYAAGAVLYEMATGQRLFPNARDSRLIDAILHAAAVLPQTIHGSVSSELNRIILKCLDKEPAHRYQSAAELKVDLTRLTLAAREAAAPFAKRRRATAWVVSLTVLLVVAGLTIKFDLGGIQRWLFRRAPISSIAVLPLENLSHDSEQEYFADGITEALITNLAQIDAVRVVSRTSVMPYKHTNKSLPQIARELAVDAIVEGSVERAGNRVRISAELIRASNDQHLWAQAYERDLRDVLMLQDEVARSIVREIQVKVTPAEKQRLAHGRAIDPQVYELYLKGRYFWVNRTEASIQKAITYFQEAIDRDPTYAAAYSGLADCYSSLGVSFDVGSAAPMDIRPKALAAANKAIAADDSLAEAHSSLGFIKLNFDWDWSASEQEFRRAISLNPGWANGHHWYAHNLMSSGRVQEAEAESLRALQLDPLSPLMNAHLGWHYYFAREYDKSLEQLRKTLELMPNYGLAFWYSAWDYEQKGMYDEALQQMERARELLPGNLIVQADRAHLYAVSGKKLDARRELHRLQSLANQKYVNPFEIALIYVGLADKDEAFRWLDEAYRARSDLLAYLGVDPRLDSLRSDTRFAELTRRVGIPNTPTHATRPGM